MTNLVSLGRSKPEPESRPEGGADAAQEGQPLRVTEAAAREILRQAMKRGTPSAAIRVGLRGGGCTGFSYLFDWEDGEPRKRDTVIEAHGVRVYVDPKSLKYLAGMELDFVTQMMGHGFQFNNPNAKGSCGCGASVSF